MAPDAITTFEWAQQAGYFGLVLLILAGVWKVVVKLMEHKQRNEEAAAERNAIRDKSYHELVETIVEYGLKHDGKDDKPAP